VDSNEIGILGHGRHTIEGNFQMRTFAFAWLAAFALQACHSAKSPMLRSEADRKYFAVALAYFEDGYRQWGSNWNASEAKGDHERACFFFQGTGEFARPGYFVRVCVNRADGVVTMVPGE